MSTTVSFNGSNYTVPAVGERNWGSNVSNLLIALAGNSLSKAGGAFTLSAADVNFGASFGLVSIYYKSRTSNISTTGVLRLANNEGIGWRNAANGADKILKLDAGDRLEIDGVDIVTVSSTDTLTNKTLSGNTATNLISGSGTLTLNTSGTVTVPNGTDTLVARTSTDTLTNKTLTAPVISTISNSGTITLPTGTRTLVARDTTDTLTNKTLTAPVISTISNTGTLTLPTSTDTLVGRATTDTLTNKTLTSPAVASPTFSDYTLFTEVSAPSTPASGKVAIYAKSDKKIYKKDSNGTESELGAGGTSLINYVSNPDFETGATTGWATYKDSGATPTDGTGGSPTTLTLSANSSSPMRGSYDFKVAKSAANSQGEGFSYDFTIKTPDKSKKLSISFDLNSSDSNFTAGDVVVYVYDVTNAALITPSSTSLPKVGASTYNITFDSTTSTSYRLIFHWSVTTATAVNLYFDSFIVGPGQVVQGAVISEWQNFTPSTTNTWTTNATWTGKYRREGSMARIKYGISLTGAPGGTAQLGVNLPTGLTLDASNILALARAERLGTATYYNASGVGYMLEAWAEYDATATTSAKARFLAVDDVNTSTHTVTSITATYPATWGNLDYVNVELLVPIAEWAGNGTVNLGAGAQEEYCYNTDVSSTASVTASGFAAGPSGVLVSSSWSVGTSYVRRVQFQYPIQDSDLLQVEVYTSSLGWLPWGDRLGSFLNTTSTYNYGVNIVLQSSTTADVYFSNGGYAPPATFGSATGIAFSGLNAGGYKWRVRKAKASSPVGFGLAGTDGSSGLYKAGQAPGLVTGAAIPAGYVGEVITSASITATALSTSYANITNASLALSAGIWQICYSISLQPSPGSTVGNETLGSVQLYNSTGAAAISGTQRTVGARNSASASFYVLATAACTSTVNISSATTYTIQGKRTDAAGTGTCQLLNSADYTSSFYAIRIA